MKNLYPNPVTARRRFITLGDRARVWIRRRLEKIIIIREEYDYFFRCRTEEEFFRARTMLTKEPGTIQWLRRELRPDDVFFDIGAGTGVFSLFAAARLRPPGKVVAFEPHAPTASSLMENVALNGFKNRVDVSTAAITGTYPFNPLSFHYHDFARGSAQHQAHLPRDSKDRKFVPVFSERKASASIDRLADSYGQRPTVVKIDVDGAERSILEGMTVLLSMGTVRTIQVELNVRDRDYITRLLESAGYEFREIHRSVFQQHRLDRFEPAKDVPCNGIYYRRVE